MVVRPGLLSVHCPHVDILLAARTSCLQTSQMSRLSPTDCATSSRPVGLGEIRRPTDRELNLIHMQGKQVFESVRFNCTQDRASITLCQCQVQTRCANGQV